MADERTFMADTHQGKVIITRTSKRGQVFRVEMSPSEVNKATQIVGIALATVEHDALPDHITNTPFVIRFFKNRVYALERTDFNFSMPFKASEGDELIETLQMAMNMCLNEQTMGRVVPVGTTTMPNLATDESF